MSIKWGLEIWQCKVRDDIRLATIERDKAKEALDRREQELKWLRESQADLSNAMEKLGYGDEAADGP